MLPENKGLSLKIKYKHKINVSYGSFIQQLVKIPFYYSFLHMHCSLGKNTDKK